MDVVSYLRRSVDDDATSAHTRHTIETQRATCAKYAAEHGLAIIAELVDDDVSGALAPEKRPGLSAALRAVGHGVGLVVAKADRLSRDPGAMTSLLARFARRKIELHVASRGRVRVESASERTMLMMESVFGAHERAVVGERVAATLAHLRDSGRRYSGRAPYGMRFDDGALVVDEAEQALIAEARSLVAAGLSQRAVAATLTERGHVGRTGRPYSHCQVRAMLAL